ncbi:metallophosphoesterase family protein [Stygiolobus caldivivus]|uniref:Metallophosphoesterase n=1 Tax=Stygiolobus caldivivus TaxID=2824673 RepID=A0A8D5U748_9CREN|nr:metallophosphoesterase [Stygiolobus caldivivus]BCU70452.1 metallophosphoesterase [Stygiolobus caldivivus]
MLIAATSDLHSPKYLTQFFASFSKIRELEISLFLLAGDLCERGEYKHFTPIYDMLKKYTTVAVFGNEDFTDKREYYKKFFNEIRWLEDEKLTLEAQNLEIDIIGSEGVLEKPTNWQKLHGITEEIYEKRREKIEKLLCEARGDIKILLTHYASTFKTVFGERKSIYPNLGYRILETTECSPDLAIHGHAHYAKATYGEIGKTRVYNVAFPANKKIVIIDLDPLIRR